jgi:AcrR family transcriptional regulator
MQGRRSNASRSQETRHALVAAARELFAEQGYSATGTPDVAARAGLTRGALYHHFADKQAVFRAVVEAEAAAVAREIERGSSLAKDPLDALRRGAKSYFAAMSDPARARLLLIEGPSVLGAPEMRRIDLETGGRELRLGLAEVLGGRAAKTEIEARADLISAMFDRAALARANGASRAVYERVLDSVLVAVVGGRVQMSDSST